MGVDEEIGVELDEEELEVELGVEVGEALDDCTVPPVVV